MARWGTDGERVVQKWPSHNLPWKPCGVTAQHLFPPIGLIGTQHVRVQIRASSVPQGAPESRAPPLLAPTGRAVQTFKFNVRWLNLHDEPALASGMAAATRTTLQEIPSTEDFFDGEPSPSGGRGPGVLVVVVAVE